MMKSSRNVLTIVLKGGKIMLNQLNDLERIDESFVKRIERYQQRYRVSYSELAWILLRVGTFYYFKDISTRGLNDNLFKDDFNRS